ncbi:MAG: proteasome assembly chaperone family protein [Candidatus Thermoplasmatota archaeon]|nr:proteasome assembly chaperone family protein [Candidatus Thermoplasmatota archaeon]
MTDELEFLLCPIGKEEMPKLHKPVLIEGLPGVGNVGKLAAEHLAKELGAVHFSNIYSKHFPPQVLVGDDGITDLVCNQLYHYKRPERSDEPWKDRDLLFLLGDYQGLTPEGQYSICYEIMTLAKEMGVERLFTLGGYGLGKIVEKHRVLGAATDKSLVDEMKEHGVIFGNGEQPGSGIVGASGLLLGFAPLFGMSGVCLMGETSGYFVDPKSSRAVLEVLTKILGTPVEYVDLENRAKEIDQITSKLKELEDSPVQDPGNEDTYRYIG